MNLLVAHNTNLTEMQIKTDNAKGTLNRVQYFKAYLGIFIFRCS